MQYFPAVFIDDLTTFSASRQHTQDIADLISATNAILGTKFAVNKFRASTTRPPEHPEQGMGTITVYDWQWNPTAVPIQNSAMDIKHLGVHFSLQGKWEDQVKATINQIRKLGTILRSKRASTNVKLVVLQLSILTGISYRGGLSGWSLEQVERVAATFTAIVRKALKLPTTYPAALIHLKIGGHKSPSLAQTIMDTRWRTLVRCLHAGGGGRQTRSSRPKEFKKANPPPT